eukprot:gene11834-8143_t
MSTLSYEAEYRQVLFDLQDLKQEDVACMMLEGDRLLENAVSVNDLLGFSPFVRYMQLAKRLSLLQNVELQPQKLQDVRSLLDACLGRMIEIFNSGQSAGTASRQHFMELSMMELKLTPSEMEVPIPRYILDDRAEELKDRRNVVLSLQRFFSESEPEAPVSNALEMPSIRDDPTKAIPPLPSKKAPPVPPKTMEEIENEPMQFEAAVRALQICERGRQARQRAKFQLGLYQQQRYSVIHGQDFNTVTGKDRAATIIQTVVQGYLERKRAAERFKNEELFLGMKPSENNAREEAEAARRRVEERKAKQKMNVMALRQKTAELKANIMASEGPKTMECMLDEILVHMAYARLENKDGQIPEIPTPDELKSQANITERNDRRPSEQSSVADRKPSQAPNAGPGGGKDGKGKKGKKDEEVWIPPVPSAFWAPIDEAQKRYDSIWREKFTNVYLHDGNMDLPFDETVLRANLLEGPRGIMNQLRLCVDELVLMEVNNLKERLEWERKNKRQKKKQKKPKKPKKPRLKDPWKGMDLDTMVNLLVHDNILQLPPSTVRLHDFIGSGDWAMQTWIKEVAPNCTPMEQDLMKKWVRVMNGWNDVIEQSLKIPKAALTTLFDHFLSRFSKGNSDPNTQIFSSENGMSFHIFNPKYHDRLSYHLFSTTSPAELRTYAAIHGVLPLGSQTIRDMLVSQCRIPRAILLYGFPGCGKTMLSYGICNEVGANFFNLSPKNFRSLKGFAKQIQRVFYVARIKAPSIIYIEDVEYIFPGRMKKMKKKLDPALKKRGKKLKKELKKAMATILPAERVLVLFVCSQPWMIDSKVFPVGKENVPWIMQEFMYFPTPAYGHRIELLQHFLSKKLGGRHSGLEEEGLRHVATLTEGYTIQQLQDLVDITLHPRRVQCIPQRKLEAKDFTAAISTIPRLPPEHFMGMEAFNAFLQESEHPKAPGSQLFQNTGGSKSCPMSYQLLFYFIFVMFDFICMCTRDTLDRQIKVPYFTSTRPKMKIYGIIGFSMFICHYRLLEFFFSVDLLLYMITKAFFGFFYISYRLSVEYDEEEETDTALGDHGLACIIKMITALGTHLFSLKTHRKLLYPREHPGLRDHYPSRSTQHSHLKKERVPAIPSPSPSFLNAVLLLQKKLKSVYLVSPGATFAGTLFDAALMRGAGVLTGFIVDGAVAQGTSIRSV